MKTIFMINALASCTGMFRQAIEEGAEVLSCLRSDWLSHWHCADKPGEDQVGKASKEIWTIRDELHAIGPDIIEKHIPGCQLQHLQRESAFGLSDACVQKIETGSNLIRNLHNHRQPGGAWGSMKQIVGQVWCIGFHCLGLHR